MKRSAMLALCLSLAFGPKARGQQAEPPGAPAGPLWSATDLGPPSFTVDKVQPSNADRAYPLVPGGFVSIYGSRLGPDRACSAKPDVSHPETRNPSYPDLWVFGDNWSYPTALCDVQVLVNGVPAGLLYVQERQINFKVPQQTPAGTAQLQVVYAGNRSSAATIPIAAPFLNLSLSEPAYVGMPVWINLSFAGRSVFEYPVSLNPADIGCADVQVRRNGKLLPQIPEIEQMEEGVVGGFACGMMISLPSRRREERLPLHLLYRFSEPGVYEVRYISRRLVPPPPPGGPEFRTGAESEWTPITVQAAAKDQRTKWLAQMAAKMPTDPTELLADFLPNVLGIPDAASLAIVKQYLNDPNEYVRRYAMHGMHYWPEAEVHAVVWDLLRSKGPSDEIANELTREPLTEPQADALTAEAVPYLQSDSPVAIRGAVFLIRNLSFPQTTKLSAPVRAQAESALVAATQHVMATEDHQLMIDFTGVLGMMRDGSSHDTLWKLTDQPVTRGQALLALTWRKDPADLPRLAKVLLDGTSGDLKDREIVYLPSELYQGYGKEALPYLETAIQSSQNRWVRYDCARVLMRENRASGFAVALEAIQNDPRNKRNFIELLKGQFPELRNADEAAIVAFLKTRVH